MIGLAAVVIGILMLLGVPSQGVGFFVLIFGVICMSLQK
ncbi:hypothetical protein ACVWZK_006450 [Bradyrhizobium sp. GM0.4]